jgi:GST-like protein
VVHGDRRAPAVARARAVGKDHESRRVNDEETKRALFPSNYPATDG